LAPLDRTLLISFGALMLLGLGIAFVCFRRSIRVAGDKIVEEWTQMDQLSLMQQLGVIPSQS